MLTARKVQYWWRGFNDAVFGGKLRRMKIIVGWTEPAVWGWCTSDREIIISDRIESEEDQMATLLHEMVHQWQLENGYEMDHGDSFEQWREPCLSRTGLEL